MARTSIAISLILVETLREVELGRAPFVPNRLILHAYGILMTHTIAKPTAYQMFGLFVVMSARQTSASRIPFLIGSIRIVALGLH